MLKEAKKAAALAAGADWKSDDSDSEFPVSGSLPMSSVIIHVTYCLYP